MLSLSGSKPSRGPGSSSGGGRSTRIEGTEGTVGERAMSILALLLFVWVIVIPAATVALFTVAARRRERRRDGLAAARRRAARRLCEGRAPRAHATRPRVACSRARPTFRAHRL